MSQIYKFHWKKEYMLKLSLPLAPLNVSAVSALSKTWDAEMLLGFGTLG